MFSCKYCKISYNTCFEEYLRMAASENNKKRFLGKTTGHNDHYMTNIGGQRSKIAGNWPMNGPYLQPYQHALRAWKKITTRDFEESFVHQCDFLVLNDTPPLRIDKNLMAVKKSSSWVVTENTLDQSDCIFFLNFNISTTIWGTKFAFCM